LLWGQVLKCFLILVLYAKLGLDFIGILLVHIVRVLIGFFASSSGHRRF
jgi:hypothetical protein